MASRRSITTLPAGQHGDRCSGPLFSNTGGNYNSATGVYALYSNINGWYNNAVGAYALANNISGGYNTANGYGALYGNTASYNTANGYQALDGNTTGAYNTAIGYSAGLFVTGNFNVCIGSSVYGVAGEDYTTRIDNICSSVASGRAVYVNSDNKLGTLASSRRFKDEIKPMNKASEALLALKPVTFRYKKEIEPNGAIQFGLIAEEVEKVNPDLVGRNKKGEVETVRYEAVNAMLLNEFLKKHRKVEKLASTVANQEVTIASQQKEFQSAIAQQQKDFEATTAQQQKEIQVLTASLTKQAAQIQKVTAQLEAGKPAPKVALNDQ